MSEIEMPGSTAEAMKKIADKQLEISAQQTVIARHQKRTGIAVAIFVAISMLISLADLVGLGTGQRIEIVNSQPTSPPPTP